MTQTNTMTAMALAMAAAQNRRKTDMNASMTSRAWFSVGQVSLIVTVDPDHPVVGRGSYRITTFNENDDGTLTVHINRVEDGVSFTSSQSRPNEFTMSQAFSQRHEFFDRLKDLPQFGKTEVTMVNLDADYNKLQLRVPAQRRALMKRRLKRERSQALAEAIQTTATRHSDEDFRAALKLINEYRDQQSGNVKFRINEEGLVKATLVVEY